MASHRLLEELDLGFLCSGDLVEIGSSRENAHDSSTFYFNQISKNLGVSFWSVDLSPKSFELAKSIAGTNAIFQDGKAFQKEFIDTNPEKRISCLYLDNFDVVYNEKHFESLKKRVGDVYEKLGEVLSNERSASIHFEQLMTAYPVLSATSVIIIDDTMTDKNDSQKWWGKGSLCVNFLLERKWKIKFSNGVGVLFTSPNFNKFQD